MKKAYIYSVCLLLNVWVLSSCEKEAVNVKLPEQTPKLVISSFISPQDTLTWVMVANSRPVYGVSDYNDERRVSDAIVTLSNGAKEVQLVYYSKQKGYAIDPGRFRIQAGKTYTLHVRTPDGRHAEASCTIPVENIPIANVEIDTIEVQDSYYNGVLQPPRKVIQLSYQWQDIASRPDYYRAFGEIKRSYRDSYGNEFVNIAPWFSSILNDEGKEGGIITAKVNLDFYNPGQPSGDSPLVLYLYFMHVDDIYYKYHKALGEYEGDNPFAEPVLLYSNVQGGLGIFCSFNRSELEVELK